MPIPTRRRHWQHRPLTHLPCESLGAAPRMLPPPECELQESVHTGFPPTTVFKCIRAVWLCRTTTKPSAAPRRRAVTNRFVRLKQLLAQRGPSRSLFADGRRHREQRLRRQPRLLHFQPGVLQVLRRKQLLGLAPRRACSAQKHRKSTLNTALSCLGTAAASREHRRTRRAHPALVSLSVPPRGRVLATGPMPVEPAANTSSSRAAAAAGGVQQVWFRGAAVLDAALLRLLDFGLGAAERVMLTGTAGPFFFSFSFSFSVFCFRVRIEAG